MQQFELLHERLAHDDLDETIMLTYARTGTWMGLRVHELFQLTGNGRFLWEWEDEYTHLPYQRRSSVLDRHTTSQLFHLFQTGLPALLPMHQGQSRPALPPDSIPIFFNITVGDLQANYICAPNQQPLQPLLDQFICLREQQRIFNVL